ncbi:MAG: phosphoadenylyl-sulfate reductase [Gemmatimonadota bacterium]
MKMPTMEPVNHEVEFDDLEIGEIAMELDHQGPWDVIEWAYETFGSRVGIVTALQVDGMVTLDMAYDIAPDDVRVITVDTGRLPQETYDFIDQVRERYPRASVEVLLPDHEEVEAMVARSGVNLFRQSVPLRFVCCHVRKVRPLTRALRGLDAWFTGLRRDQWASRAAIRKVELDHDHGGLVKLNPLADWTKEEVWQYLEDYDVPTHPLYAKGYTSIGCTPCSRPIEEGEDDRAGRWWWEEDAPKECGIHCPIDTGNFEHEAEMILAEINAEEDEGEGEGNGARANGNGANPKASGATASARDNGKPGGAGTADANGKPAGGGAATEAEVAEEAEEVGTGA